MCCQKCNGEGVLAHRSLLRPIDLPPDLVCMFLCWQITYTLCFLWDNL